MREKRLGPLLGPRRGPVGGTMGMGPVEAREDWGTVGAGVAAPKGRREGEGVATLPVRRATISRLTCGL